MKADDILGKIGTVSISHGGSTRQVSEPEICDTEMKLVSLERTMDSRWIAQTDTESIATFLWETSQKFISQLKKYFFEVCSKTTEAVGNVVFRPSENVSGHTRALGWLLARLRLFASAFTCSWVKHATDSPP